jgi:segregation and condensation protein B
VELGRSYGALLDRQADAAAPEPRAAAPTNAAVTPEPVAPPPLVRIIEALLFVGGPPLTAARACETVRGLTPAQLEEAIDTLNHDYRRQGRPYHVEAREHGHVMVLRPRFRAVHDRLYGGTREARLSPPAIDVLSLVAYRQPATKPEIDALRGADSGALLRQLVRRGLVAVVQRGGQAQREVAYGTTPRFLELFGLRSLDDLPQTQDLQKL